MKTLRACMQVVGLSDGSFDFPHVCFDLHSGRSFLVDPKLESAVLFWSMVHPSLLGISCLPPTFYPLQTRHGMGALFEGYATGSGATICLLPSHNPEGAKWYSRLTSCSDRYVSSNGEALAKRHGQQHKVGTVANCNWSPRLQYS